MFGGRDKVRKSIPLLFHAPRVVPGLSQLASAADVRNGEDRASIQQAQTIRIEVHRNGDAVAPVAVKEQRGRTITRCVAAVDDGKRHPCLVGSGGMQTLTYILRRVVATKNGLLLSKDSLPGADVVVKDRARSYEGFILKADVGGVELRIFTDGCVVGWVREFNAMRCFERRRGIGVETYKAEMRKSALALKKNEVGLENFRSRQHHIRAVGDDFPPEYAARVGNRSGHKAERAAAGIRADIEHATAHIARRSGMVVGVVFMGIFARCNQPKFTERLVGPQKPDFAGRMARDSEKKKGPAAATFHFDAETCVGLFIEQDIRLRGAHDMPVETIRALRSFVFDRIKERAIVRGPSDTRNSLDALWESITRGESLHMQCVLTVPSGVDRIGEELIVFADLKRAQTKERMALRELVLVE